MNLEYCKSHEAQIMLGNFNQNLRSPPMEAVLIHQENIFQHQQPLSLPSSRHNQKLYAKIASYHQQRPQESIEEEVSLQHQLTIQ